MTGRDRLVLIGLGALAVLGAVWLLLVAPERKQAAKLNAEVSAATAQLASAQDQASTAHAAQARYSAAYSSIVSLGKAVPADQEVPSLMYQLAQASNEKHVEFNSIVSGAGGASGGSASPAASAPTTAAADGRRRLHPDALHVRVQRQLPRPLPHVQRAEPLHRAHGIGRPAGQRTPADDPGRETGA